MRIRNGLLGGIACACAIGSIAPALADSNPEDLQEIVVTARRVEERLQDVPISMSVFTEEQLESHNIVNADDLGRYTPSLSVNDRFGSDRTTYAIRGFNQDTGTAPSVGVYFADVVAPRSPTVLIPGGDGAGPGSFFDLQNIQVLKGPQGTLFGLNTTGGDVMLVPQKPTSALEGYVQGALGDYDYHEAEGVINIPVNDVLRLRFGVQHKDRKGYLDNKSGIGPDNFDDLNYTAVRASAVWDVTSNLENYTIFSYANSDTNGSSAKLVAADAAVPAVGPLIGIPAVAELAQESAAHFGFYDFQQSVDNAKSKVQQWQVINTTTWNATDTFTVKNIASYAELKSYLSNPLIGSNFVTQPSQAILGATPGLHYVFFATSGFPGEPASDESTYTEELRLQGHAFDDRLTFQGGGYSEFSRPLGLSTVATPLFGSCKSFVTFDCTNPFPFPLASLSINQSKTLYRDLGLYAQSTFAITRELKLTTGIRETWDHEEWDAHSTNTPILSYPLYGMGPTTCTAYTGHDANCNRVLEESSNAPTWLIDLEYQPTSDYLLYGKYARGYRAGAVEVAIVPPFTTVQPEKLNAYEIGAKTSFLEPVKGTFDVAVFYNDFYNQQLQLNFNPIPGSGLPATAVPVNAGKSRLWGVEAGFNLSPFNGLLLNVDYTYLNTKILSFPNFTTLGGGLYQISSQYQPGDSLPLSPRNKVVIGANYTLPLTDTIGKISFGASFSQTSRQSVAPGDRTVVGSSIQSFAQLGATGLLDLNITWKSVAGSPVDVSAFGTNVTNFHYYTFVQQTGTDGAEFATVGPPAMFGVRVRYSFRNASSH